jgi:hypothetical protein
MWSHHPCNVVRLADARDVVDKIAYVMANPVAAGLVPRPSEWPGLLVRPEQSMRVERPSVYFDPRGHSPRVLVLHTELPTSSSEEVRASWWRKNIERELSAKVADAQRRMRKACRPFVGRAGVRKKSIAERAQSIQPKRRIVPTLAAKAVEARRAMLVLQHAFRDAYRAALAKWKAGARDVLFPHGTWWMRVHHGASCDAPFALA